MKTFFYVPGSGNIIDQFQEEIMCRIADEHKIVCESYESLKANIPIARAENGLLVILTQNKNDLLDIYTLKHQLLGLNIILILPDKNISSFYMGNLLNPKLLTYVKKDFSDISEVLSKIDNLQFFPAI